MTSNALLQGLVLAVVTLSWFLFALIFVLRKSPPASPERKRASGSIVGVLLQGVSFGIVWSVHRQYLTPLVTSNKSLELGISILTVLLAASSVAFTLAAVRALGKEWSITARVVEGHKLATHGPYALVRHPIYTGMLGMLLATGLAVSSLIPLGLALVFFVVGTLIRMRREEGLLRETFGSEFDDYAHRVSAIIPGLF